MITVDTNPGEDGVYAALVAAVGEEKVSRQLLEVGDVLLHVPGGRIVLERKAWGDLVASLRDSRYSNQKLRLLAERERAESAGERLDIVYVIETRGVPQWSAKTNGVANNQPFAALTKMTMRDRISVLYTATPEDTAAQAAYIYAAALKNGFDAQAKANQVAASGYAGVCKFTSKRKNADANPLQMMLSTITGVSGAKAQAVADAYPTAAALVRALERAGGSNELLANLAVGGGKRLGPALAQKIRASLCD